MANELEQIVQSSGLEETKSNILLEQFKDYFSIAAEWEKKAKMIAVTDESQSADMQMARTGRLFLREKRIAIEKTRKTLKEQSLREGKAIDGIANVLKALILPIEEYLDKQEHFVEIKAKEKVEAERLEAERKAEEQRIESERLDVLEKERIEKALPYRDFWTVENYAFREMSETNFVTVINNLKAAKAAHDKEQERVRKENERLQKEAEEKERQQKLEREKHEKELAAQKAKAEADRKKQEEKLRKEREEAERKRREAEAKARAEQERIKKEAEAKAEADRKEKERLMGMLKNKIECPYCHKKFQVK